MTDRPSRIGWLLLAATVLLALLVGTVGWRDESYSELGGDEPKYLVNGVFFLDLVKDAPVAAQNFPEYARRYYARYPALSLGHHPVLPSLMAVPAYALLGISVRSARLVPLASFAIACVLLLLLVERVYDRSVAIVATAIFALGPVTAGFSRVLTSEMPALAAVMAAAFFCERYSRTERSRDLWLFTLSAAICVWAKQMTAIMLPVFALEIIRHRGARVLLRRDAMACALTGLVLLAPLVLLTWRFSAGDLRWVAERAIGHPQVNYPSLFVRIMARQLSWPVVCLVALGVARSAVNRDGRSVLFITWVLTFAVFVVLLTKGVETSRFTLYWTPALAALAASGVSGWKAPTLRAAMLMVTLVAIGNEAVAASRIQLGGADGYEDAARYVAEHTQGPATVLFSGPVDTGYFVFFVRKHDPDRRLIILRSDKVLRQQGDIQPILRAFGTRFIVVEDQLSATTAPGSLRTRLSQPPFVERFRVPLRSTDARLRDVDLAIFENVGVPAPDPDARLALALPLAGMKIDIRLGDLMER